MFAQGRGDDGSSYTGGDYAARSVTPACLSAAPQSIRPGNAGRASFRNRPGPDWSSAARHSGGAGTRGRTVIDQLASVSPPIRASAVGRQAAGAVIFPGLTANEHGLRGTAGTFSTRSTQFLERRLIHPAAWLGPRFNMDSCAGLPCLPGRWRAVTPSTILQVAVAHRRSGDQ